jgi:hypothetical protein
VIRIDVSFNADISDHFHVFPRVVQGFLYAHPKTFGLAP